jgi:two-component system, NarL family, invasion response regulator UvrY
MDEGLRSGVRDAAAGPRELLLVDDHTIVREGIKRILEPVAAEWSVTEAATAFQALECLRRKRFALAIVDLSMPGMTGLELIRRIKTDYPSVAVMVLTMHAEEQYAMRAFKAGANGYLTKDGAASELIAAVNKVASGGAYVTASLAERVVQQLSGVARAPRHSELSDRELDVLQRIVAGERLTDIAQALHLSVKTVSTHKTRIQEKLQLPNTAALIRYGLEHQLDKEDSGFDALPQPAGGGAA